MNSQECDRHGVNIALAKKDAELRQRLRDEIYDHGRTIARLRAVLEELVTCQDDRDRYAREVNALEVMLKRFQP
jgi:hypothetical protein